MKIRDAFWIWGQDTGSHHLEKFKEWNIPGVNRMGPVEGAAWLGIPNCCRVVFNGSPKPPFDDESEKLKFFDKVVWSIMGDASSTRNDQKDDLTEVLRQAKKYPNIVGGVLDDFFVHDKRTARMSPERMQEVADTLHAANLSLWLVFYGTLLDGDYRAWLSQPDVITYWSWTSEQLKWVEDALTKVIGMTPGKKHYAGCYLYNYGDCRPLSREEMNFQLDIYYRFLKTGKIDGVIVCSNTVCDCGLEAVDCFREWMYQHGDETI